MDKFKHVISDYFKEALQVLQAENIECDGPLKTNEYTNAICWAIEAMFLHGLKSNNTEKNFLGLVKTFSHKSLFEQIRSLKQITTDVGRCRSWIRLALNDMTLEGYINVIVRDHTTLKRWYGSSAYFMDAEQTDVMLTYLKGVSAFQFDLVCNASVLNQWTLVPLQLAGIRSNANLHWPKSPIKSSSASLNQRNCKGKTMVKSASNSSFQPIASKMKYSESLPLKIGLSSSLVSDDFSPAELDGEFQNFEDSYSCSPTSDISRPDFVDNRFLDYYQTVYDVSANASDDVSLNDVAMATVAEEEENEKRFDRIVRENLEKFPFDYGGCGVENMPVNDELDLKRREVAEIEIDALNSVPGELTPTVDEILPRKEVVGKATIDQSVLEESFDELLNNYFKPHMATSPMASFDQIFNDLTKSLQENNETQLDLEQRMGMQHGIDVFNLYTTIPRERGLVNQQYQCQSCSNSIGLFYGKERLCNYNLLYYCCECLDRAETCIPYKIIYNWDFSNYRVSNESLIQLNMLKSRPILNIQKLNPLLYDHVEELSKKKKVPTATLR